MELSDKVLAKTSENWVYPTALISVLKESLQQRQIEVRITVTRGTKAERRPLKGGFVHHPALRAPRPRPIKWTHAVEIYY